ncbi:MAG: alpha/beta fold hydrolase [Desulfuromonadales bacterium]|nr:alpha/beta fold hydrolase [Desulfuromonadales bacterium]
MLDYDDHGSGPAVVLLHGFPLNRRMWQPQVEALVTAGYRVVCPDLPGFGGSPVAPGQASMDAYADALVGLLDRLGIAQAVIGGMSMGGYVLLNLLERYRSRCAAALFLVTRAAADDAAGRDKRSALAAEVEAGRPLVVADAFVELLFAPQTAKERPELIAEVRNWMAATPAAGLVAGLLAMRARRDYVARLGEFELPALVVGAELDRAVPVEHAQRLAERLPHAELQIIPQAGHMANLEQPAAFNQALLTFLKRLPISADNGSV